MMYDVGYIFKSTAKGKRIQKALLQYVVSSCSTAAYKQRKAIGKPLKKGMQQLHCLMMIYRNMKMV